ncbi:aminotransferase class V-fold PLP-dependent enzyme, partial [bacterium]|nr:aminotransferase class V-fold PLP-dependent enzyme [bacterium]
MYYFDNAATTRPYPEVIERVQECLQRDFGNPSSVHPIGVRAKTLIEESRKTLAN